MDSRCPSLHLPRFCRLCKKKTKHPRHVDITTPEWPSTFTAHVIVQKYLTWLELAPG